MSKRWGRLCSLVLVLPLLAGCRPNTTWSPDSKQIALDAQGYLFTFDVATKKFQRRAGSPQQKVMNPVWSADGQRILYYQAAMKGQDVVGLSLSQIELATGKTTPVVAKVPISKAETKPDGFQLNLAGLDELVRLMVMAGWSPDGQKLAYGGFSGQDTNIWVANADGSNSKPLLPQGKFGLYPVWSPDSQWIAYYSTLGAKTPMIPEEGAPPPRPDGPDLELIAADGSGHRVLWDSKKRDTIAGFGPAPRWSADGKSIIITVEGEKKQGSPIADTCSLWSVPVNGSEPQRIAPVPGPSPFLTLDGGLQAMTFFFAPKTPMEDAPTLGYAAAPFSSTKTFFKLNPEAMGLKPGQEKDMSAFPVPDISPDGKTIALTVVPKGSPARLLLTPTSGGPTERIEIPLPAAPPVAKAPAKTPVKASAKKKPAAKPKRK